MSTRSLRSQTNWDVYSHYKSNTKNPHLLTSKSMNKSTTRSDDKSISVNKPISKRKHGKQIPKFWMHRHTSSLFSPNGIEHILSQKENYSDHQNESNLIQNDIRLSNKQSSSNNLVKMTSNSSRSLIGTTGYTPTSPSITSQGEKNGFNSIDLNGNNSHHRKNESGFQSLIKQFNSPNLSSVMQPKDISPEEWEDAVKEWESTGEWIEARETLSGRIMWFNTKSLRIVFDNAPEGVKPISTAVLAKSMGSSHEDYLANRPLEPYENEDVVDGLLNFGMHRWDFDNDMVDIYRSSASQRPHHKMLPKPEQYCFPEYFSESPLPDLPGNQFLARIRLPQEFSQHRRYVTIRIKMDYTNAKDAIKQGVEKLDKEHQKDGNEFVLKVVGQEEYIYGKRKIIDYEAVRNAVRSEDDVEFVLIKRPDFKQKVLEAKEKQLEAKKSFETTYPDRVKDESFFPELKALEKLKPLNNKEFVPQSCVNLNELDWHYRLKIEGLSNVTNLPRYDDNNAKSIYVVAELWMGDALFETATLTTSHYMPKNEIRIGQWLSCRNLTFSNIPRESVLCFMVMLQTDNGKKPIAWTRLPIIDHRHRLRRGKYLLNLWEIPVFHKTKHGPSHDPYALQFFRYRGTMVQNNLKKQHVEDCCQLLIEFDEFAFETMAPIHTKTNKSYNERQVGGKLKREQLAKSDKLKIQSILLKNPLENLKPIEKDLIWRSRDLLWHDPSALPAFLRSVNWTSIIHIMEAHKYLEMWHPPKEPADALEFLDYRFSDTKVRETALKYLEDMHDQDLQQYLLQLVQCLKYEPHHDSALSRFLIRRGLRNPYQLGHFLFWHLKAEFHDERYSERFGVIMEEYLKHAGEHSRQLFIQTTVLKRLEVIAEKVSNAKRTQQPQYCKKLLRKELAKLNRELPETIQIPLNPRWKAKKLIIEKCRYMGSKKVPLWLVFENNDEYSAPIEVMFKSGDDLRQDMLTLQVIGVMDKIWLHNKLDLHLKPYNVIATGVNRHNEGVGMIEIVLNSKTVNSINVENGGAFNEKTINSFILQYNKGDNVKKARENFARSCAGYCVATFVLGIGDRHSDNYMVSKTGQFFHIDFGHFLGNFKSKFKIKRERSPFVFTPAMKYAIDAGEKKCKRYENFVQWVCNAYNVLRVKSRLLLLLFALMTSAGMPELMSERDIGYLTNMLNLHYDQNKASDHIKKLVNQSLKDRARLVDNAIHAAVHR